MFKPTEQDNLRSLAFRKQRVCGSEEDKPEVTVWITNEPRVRTRFDPQTQNGFPGVQHFEHYYELLAG